MQAIKTILFMFCMFGITAVLSVVAIPALIIPGGFVWWVYEVWIKVNLWSFYAIFGVTIEIKGRENIPDRPVLIASKHQAMWDTIIVFEIFKRPSVVLKKELLYIPIYGWVANRLGMIGIDRSGAAKALKAMVAVSKKRIAEGRSIVIFPEGTRVKPGENIGYKPGVAALYRQLDVDCLPIALNSGCCWPNKGWNFRGGHITLEILPPIPAGLPRKTFMSELETRVEAASNRLATECPERGPGL